MRVPCDVPGCTARKPTHKMFRVRRSREDPTILGHACSLPHVGKVLAADPGPVFGIPTCAYAPVTTSTPGEPLTRERLLKAAGVDP